MLPVSCHSRRAPFWSWCVLALLLAGGCKPLHMTGYTAAYQEVNAHAGEAADVEALIDPYRDSLAASMNAVVARLGTELSVAQPECTMGNHVASVLFNSAAAATGDTIDCAIMNIGGLRIPWLGAGDLRVSDAYQIMPFDNQVSVMELPGAVVLAVADRMASGGGWPVHNMSYGVTDTGAVDVRIGGRPVAPDETYKVALSDYLAEGGDHLAILKEYTYYNTGILLRDAILGAWKAAAATGTEVKAYTDGRVWRQTD